MMKAPTVPAKRLNVFDIFILVRNVTEKADRRAAQFENASIQPRPQVGRCIFGDEFSILHKADMMTT